MSVLERCSSSILVLCSNSFPIQNIISNSDRKMVLKHHPDKSHSRKSKLHLDAVQEYFTCITKAGEILMNKAKRRAYDSIDSTFDNYVPPVNPNSKINFYQVFAPVFEMNSR